MTTRKRIVITGVSRGLGLALCEGFIAAGHTVLGCARSSDILRELASRHGSPHGFDRVDVARDDEVADWARSVLAQGPVDLLVNCAALMNRNAPLWEVPLDEFSQIVDVNVKGTFHVIRHFAPAMAALGRGVIVNFSSTWGRSTAADVAPYCATKWAVEGLTQALAQELPAGMAAVPLNPGIIDTAMLRLCFGDGAGGYPKPTSWARRAVPFLLSLDAKDNGRSLSVPS